MIFATRQPEVSLRYRMAASTKHSPHTAGLAKAIAFATHCGFSQISRGP